MAAQLTPEQKQRLDQTQSGVGFKVRPNKPQASAPETPLNPTALLMRAAVSQTQAQISQVDRIWEASEQAVLNHFDRRGREAQSYVAEEIMSRLGIAKAESDFFEEPPSIEGEFHRLLGMQTKSIGGGAQQTLSPAAGVIEDVTAEVIE